MLHHAPVLPVSSNLSFYHPVEIVQGCPPFYLERPAQEKPTASTAQPVPVCAPARPVQTMANAGAAPPAPGPDGSDAGIGEHVPRSEVSGDPWRCHRGAAPCLQGARGSARWYKGGAGIKTVPDGSN